MRRIITSIAVAITLLLPFGSANAQDYTRQGKTFVATQKSSSTDVKSGYTYKDSKGKTYDIYVSKSGACYIKRVSSKTGKEYKSYLSKEISS